jgi:uncharacterized membrane protein
MSALTNTLKQANNRFQTNHSIANVGKPERIASTIFGGALMGYGIKRRSPGSLFLALLGASLVYRGATGHSEAYHLLGLNTVRNKQSEDVAREFHVEKSITINRSPEELYGFWRDVENLPRFMDHLEAVTQIDGTVSHWVAKGPAGKKVEWNAEIFNEKDNELIAWRSLPGSEIANAGSVRFEKAPGRRGTRVDVTLNYNPPAGKASVLLAKLLREEPGQLIEKDLKRLKQLMEAGEIPTVEGQPSGRAEEHGSAARTANQRAHHSGAGFTAVKSQVA